MNSFSKRHRSSATPAVIGQKYALGILALALLVTAACSSNPQTYVERGNRFAAAGKYDDAIIQYRKALQKSPQFGEAHYRLALADLKKNLANDAYQELRRASDLMPANGEVQTRFAELCLTLYGVTPQHPKQLYEQATKIAGQLLSKNPEGFDGNRLKGALALIDLKPGEAVAYFRAADKAKPGDMEVGLGLAAALTRDNQTQAGLDLARGLIAKDKTYGRAYDFLFEQYVIAKKSQDAEDILRQKVANNPKQADYLLELARYYAVASKPAEMSSTLQKLLDDPADFPDSRMRVGNFYGALGKPDEALRMFQEGVKVDPKRADEYRKSLVKVLAGQRKFSEAIQQLNEVLKAHPDDKQLKLDRALIWLEEGKPENLDPAIAELRAQLAEKPQQDQILHYQLGLALARKGDKANLESARREFQAAAQKNRGYLPPRFALASLDLSQQRPQEALPVSEEILAVAPANQEGQLLNAVCLTSLGRFAEARAKLNHLLQESPKLLGAQFQMGVLAISEKKYKEAEDIFSRLQQVTGGDPRVLSGLAEAYKGENQSGRAMQLLQDDVKRNPNSPAARWLLGQFALASGNYDIAIEQYKQLAATNPKSADIQLRLGQAYAAKSDYADAVGSFEKAAQNDPKSLPAAVALAEAYYSEGKIDQAKSGYRRALTLKGDEPRALNNLAFIMLESGESPDEALKLAQRGLQAVQDNPSLKASLSDTVGWAYLKKKMYDEAVQTFQNLVAANSGNATFGYHLGAAFYAKGDRQKARTALQAALAAKPQSDVEPKIRELLGKL